MTAARFMASMFMHINVEKDVKNGISYMKYCVNHYEDFTNPYAAFSFGILQSIICLIVEFNVMLILTSMPDVVSVIMKYVSLAAIANIPRFYFASLTTEHKLTKCRDMKLKIKKWRTRDQPMKNAPFMIKLLRIVTKFMRLFYSSWSYYFMPFTAVFLNFNFMIYTDTSNLMLD